MQTIQLFYQSGKIKEEYHIQNYKKNGVHRTWYENGVTSAKATFVNDNIHGFVYRYNKEGEIMYQVEYKEGRLHGKSIYYYKDKKKRIESDYYDNLLHGAVRIFVDDKLVDEKNYLHGMEVKLKSKL